MSRTFASRCAVLGLTAAALSGLRHGDGAAEALRNGLVAAAVLAAAGLFAAEVARRVIEEQVAAELAASLPGPAADAAEHE